MDAHGSSIPANCIHRFDDDMNDWINLARVTTVCRKRNQVSSQASFIKVFKLEHRVIMRRGKNRGERVDIALVKDGKENPDFKPTTMDAFVKLNDVLRIPEIRSRVISTLSVDNQQTAVSRNVESLPESTSTGEPFATRKFYENQVAPFDRILNLKLCGLYFVDFGQVSDLRESMPLDQEKYPLKTFGRFRIGKLGCTEDFQKRFPRIRHDYGRFTSTFTFRWFMLIPYSKRYSAESRLITLVDQDGMKLKFHSYREFVIYHSARDQDLKNLYHRVGEQFAAPRVVEAEIVTGLKLALQQNEHQAELLALQSEQATKNSIIHDLQLQLLHKDMELHALRNRK